MTGKVNRPNLICDPDTVFVSGITTETPDMILAFAGTSIGRVNSYYSTSVRLFEDDCSAIVRFSKV